MWRSIVLILPFQLVFPGAIGKDEGGAFTILLMIILKLNMP
jgi:hypothetical protein